MFCYSLPKFYFVFWYLEEIFVDDILDETDLQQLLQEIYFAAPSDSFGIDTYIRTLEIVENIFCTKKQWPYCLCGLDSNGPFCGLDS